MVWSRFKVFWFSNDNPAGHSGWKKKKRHTEITGGKTMSKSGQEWALPAQLGRL